VNNITHLQALMTERLERSSASYDEALSAVNQDLFGSSSLQESEINLGAFTTASSNLAAMVASYGRLFAQVELTEFGDDLTELQTAFIEAMSEPSAEAVLSSYTAEMNALSAGAASALASAHEGAKNEPSVNADVSANVFNTLKEGLSGEVATAFFEALESPLIPEDATTDNLRKATPGVLFTYTYPEAETEDVLGIAGYDITWTNAGNTPSGRYRFDAEDGRQLRWIPSVDDLGRSFTFQMEVNGVNGKSLELDPIAVEVVDMEIESLGRALVSSAREVMAGPTLSDTHLFFASRDVATPDKFFEKVSMESLIEASDESAVASIRWQFPASLPEIYDMEFQALDSGNLIYMAAGDYGVVAYGADFQVDQPNSSPEVFINKSITAVELAFIGDLIYCLQADGNVQLTDQALSTNTMLRDVNAALLETSDPQMVAVNNEVLLASSNIENTGFQLDLTTGVLQTLEPFVTGAPTLVFDPAAIDGTALTFLGTGNLQRVMLEETVFETEEVLSTAISLTAPALVNDSMIFHFSANTLSANAVDGNVMGFVEEGLDDPLYYGFDDTVYDMVISQEPQADDEVSQATLFSFGQTDASGNRNNWAIRAHRIQATPTVIE
jgi:hypothetical protein